MQETIRVHDVWIISHEIGPVVGLESKNGLCLVNEKNNYHNI